MEYTICRCCNTEISDGKSSLIKGFVEGTHYLVSECEGCERMDTIALCCNEWPH